MMLLNPSFYRGPWTWISIAFITGVAIAGFFWPIVGLAVPVLMLIALATNFKGRRSFCAGFCPNGRSLSAVFPRITRNKPLDASFRSPMLRKMLCGFMLFCVINLLSRTGGSLALIGRVFWLIYLVSAGLSAAMAILYKPRSWCAVCPMGTLQDTVRDTVRGG